MTKSDRSGCSNTVLACSGCTDSSRARFCSTWVRRLCAWRANCAARICCSNTVLIDIRTLDGDRLLESDEVGDNVIAILAQLRDHKEAVRKIFARIAGLAAAERETALTQLLILAGLRHLATTVELEAQNMPIDLDIRDHEVIGPWIIDAERKGERKGELTVLRRQIEKRFGAIPSWAAEQLATRSTVELEELSVRVLDAQDIEELMK